MKIATLADWFGVGAIEGIRESERCGAEGVQLYAADELDPRSLTPDKLAELKRTLRDCRQTVTALCGELGGYGLEKAEDNPGKLAYLKAVMDLAQELECPVVTTHIGVVPADDGHPRYAVMRDAMREIGAYGAQRGVTLAVETGPEKISRLSRFIDDCGPGTGINFDPANLVMVGSDDPVEGVRAAGGRIVHTHAKDGVNLKAADPEWFYHQFALGGLEGARALACSEEKPLGEGSVPWDEYLTALHGIGYDGFLTIEREVKNGAEDIRMAVGFLKAKLEKLGF